MDLIALKRMTHSDRGNFMTKRNKVSQEEFDGDTLAESTNPTFLIAGINAMESLANALDFDEFLKKHSIRKKPLLQGMKLIFENLMENVAIQIQTNSAFTLSTDRTTERALYHGIPVGSLRSNSSLAKLLRGLEKVRKEVYKETSVPDFHITLSEQLSPLFKSNKWLIKNHTKILPVECHDFEDLMVGLENDDNLSPEEKKLLNRISRYGKIENTSPEYKKHIEREEREKEKERKKFEKKFLGWKVCTAYLWSRLEGKSLPDAPIDDVLSCESWEELDELYRPVANTIITKVDKRLGTGFGDVFTLTSEYRPRLLNSLMVEYNKELDEDRKLILDHSFLWYDFEILDGAHPKIFPGVSTFTNLLIGTASMERILKRKGPVEVRRILHPAGTHTYSSGGKKKKRAIHDVSYALLVPMYSNMADYSGWLVSLHCCSDYSGFSSGMMRFAEHFIKQNESYISVQDIIIPLDEFRDYLDVKLQERYESRFGGRLSESEWESITLKEFAELGLDMSAVIIELFMAISLAEANYRIRWQYRNTDIIGDKEIDVLAFKDNEV